MEIKESIKKISSKIYKYRYLILSITIGLVLMTLPSEKKSVPDTAKTISAALYENSDLEDDLSMILSKIQGAGDVYVMLTTTRGEEIIYQTDQDASNSDTSETRKINTVTVTDSSRNETGLIRQTNPPQYLGAIVICSGADNPTVRLAIVDAVSKVTGIGANRISVLKTK